MRRAAGRPPPRAPPATPGADGRELTVGQALRTPQFAAIALTYFACCAAHSGPIFHMVTHAIDRGITAMAAATVLSVAGLASLGGRSSAASSPTASGPSAPWWSGLAIQALAITFYIFTRELASFYALAMVFGFAYGGVMPLYAILVREYFGARIMGTAFGAVALVSTLGMAIGPPAGGWLFDTYGSYSWLYLSSFAIGLAAVAIASTFRPAGPLALAAAEPEPGPLRAGDPAMRFLLLMYREERIWDAKPEAERVAIRQQAIDASRPLRERGVFLAGDPLLPTSTAVTVRIAGGKPVATDGPFAETKEQLGGYSVVDVPSMKEAVAIALDHPLVRVGGHSIEVRPIRELPPR